MCRRVACARCGRPTFSGCGAHVDRVLADVPHSERCRCDAGKPAATEERDSRTRRSWFSGRGAK